MKRVEVTWVTLPELTNAEAGLIALIIAVVAGLWVAWEMSR